MVMFLLVPKSDIFDFCDFRSRVRNDNDPEVKM